MGNCLSSEARKIRQLNKDKLKVLRGKRDVIVKLWLKYSKMKNKTKEQNEFCKYLYYKLCEPD